MLRLFSPFLAIITCCLMTFLTLGQAVDLEKQLEMALKDRVLTLKNFGRADRLSFDSQGIPRDREDPGPWALYAEFSVQRVRLRDNQLSLEGPRMVSKYNTKTSKMEWFRSNRRLEVRIDVMPGAQMADITALLSNVFVSRDVLATRVPGYWRDFLTGKKEPSKTSSPTERPPVQTNQVVMQSKLIYQPRPQYPPDARAYAFEGVVIFTAEIDERGDVGRLMILVPAGGGLDESAADAVYQWKYTPTLVDAKPTRVITTITVNFTMQR